jgi:hypothetical protein
MARYVLTLALLAMLVRPAFGQNAMQQYQKMQAAMAEAQTKATKKGDERLSCDALLAELVAVTQDPKMQAAAIKLGAWSKEKQDELNAKAAAAKAEMAVGMTMGLMAGLTTALVPGLSAITDRAQMARQQTQAAQQQAEAARNIQRNAEIGDAMIPILPGLMRGERVITLAHSRNCEWTQGMMGQQ